MTETCVRCEVRPATNDGLCPHCTWAIRAEIVEGLSQFSDYLGKWAAFTEFLYERDPERRARRLEQRRRRRSWLHRGAVA